MKKLSLEAAAGVYSGTAHDAKPHPIHIERNKAFKAGAEWQRNHVWHDATEKPDGKRRYLVETHLGKRTHHSVWTKAFTPEEKVEDDGFLVRWAYPVSYTHLTLPTIA